MDLLTNHLKNLHFDKTLTLKYLPSNSVIFIQKSYIIKCLFRELLLKPGDISIIKTCRGYYICRVFPKSIIDDDIMELDSSVERIISQDNFETPVEKIQLSDIRKCTTFDIFKEIKIKVIFESISTWKMWDNYEQLIHTLKHYILKKYCFAEEYSINVKNLTECQKLGANKILIIYTNTKSLGVVGPKTNIIIDEKLTQFQYDQQQRQTTPLFALEKSLNRLIEIIKLNEIYNNIGTTSLFSPSKQILLVGPSGCGKSTLVQSLAKVTGSTIISIIGHDINKSDPGQTELSLKKIFDECFQYAKISGICIVNIEEVDNLCPKFHSSASHIQRAATQLLTLLDKAQTVPGIVVIATTNKPDALDPSIRRHGRLETEIYIGPPTELERDVILKNLLENVTIQKNLISDLSSSIANMTPGYVGADLQQLCNTIAWNVYKKMYADKEQNLEFWKNEFKKVILNITPASLKGSLGVVLNKNSSFDDLAGLGEIKKALEMAVIWPLKFTTSYSRMGIEKPKGVLLYGPPGCAKTSLIRALASLGMFSLLSISAAELYSPYVGDAERFIYRLFQRARQNSPCILFIDEIDTLAGTRGEANQVNSEVQDRIIASLLTQIDGVGHKMNAADSEMENDDGNVIVIGATNRPDMIDSALLRPGRFDTHIYVCPPHFEARLQILQLLTNKMPIASDVDLHSIAMQTNLYSGADLKNVCSEAAMIAMTEEGMDVSVIKNVHFIKALATTSPSLQKEQINQYVKFKENKISM